MKAEKYLLTFCTLLLSGILFLCACSKQQTVSAELSSLPTEPEATVFTTEEFTETIKTATTATPVSETISETTELLFTLPEKKGDMVFTDDSDNKFIQAVVQKYGSDVELLACIYVVPEADNNHVFEFNGKRDDNGKLIRDRNTLKYIYTLSADCKTITRAGGFTGNDGLSPVEGYAIFEVAKQLLVPEFEDELSQ